MADPTPQTQPTKPRKPAPTRQVSVAQGDEEAIRKGSSRRWTGTKGSVVVKSPEGRTLILNENDVRLVELRGSSPGSIAVPAAVQTPYEPDARARALLRGVKMTEDMLVAAGGAFDLAEVQALFRGVSRQAIDKRVQEGSLLAVPGPGGSRVYPTIQFQNDGTLLPGLKQVQASLPVCGAWSVLSFLMTPHAGLAAGDTPRRPVDLMREGQLELVLQAARGVGVQGS